jgi:NAD(P)-dependent dehydrogenase (short-subunit alcohol dehydrogenase family)
LAISSPDPDALLPVSAPSLIDMTNQQHGINSGFGARSTAREVLDGIDLTGRYAIVTGGYSGIGLETTRALRGAGAEVLVPARRPDTAREALAGIDGVTIDELDLGDLDSVHAFGARVLDTARPIDILINNAGIMATPETRIGSGWEAQFATNHLGHYALTNRIWPLLADGGARVVELSSRGHRNSPIRWKDIQFESGYDKWAAYGQAKTANVLFAVHLDELGRGYGVRAFACHPGGIMTPLQRHLPREEMVGLGWIDADGNPIGDGFKTPEQGAATATWCATSPQLDGRGGVYCEDCDIAELAGANPSSGVAPYAVDREQAARLWAISRQLTGIDAFAAAA